MINQILEQNNKVVSMNAALLVSILEQANENSPEEEEEDDE